jgi:CHAT domain-containing protein
MNPEGNDGIKDPDPRHPADARGCLSEDEIARYIGRGSAEEPEGEDVERHLVSCSECRRALADVLSLMNPESEKEVSDSPFSDQEVAAGLAVIKQIAKSEQRVAPSRSWIRWGAIAAAAVALIWAGVASLNSYWATRMSERDFRVAAASLEQVYTATSRSELRLDLPFHPAAQMRDSADPSSLRRAQQGFVGSIARKESNPSPYLGLGAVYFLYADYPLALEQFEAVLKMSPGNPQALVGRGVARFELARNSGDAVARMRLENEALADFESVIRAHPASLEAAYNRILLLVEIGRHQDALKAMDDYLSRDPDSLWAGKLRDIREKLQISGSLELDRKIDEAARIRDAGALARLVRLVPSRIPAAIRNALKRSLIAEFDSAATLKNEDLVWAANVLESAYRKDTNDGSWQALIRYYNGLSPPQRKKKKLLDEELQRYATLANMKMDSDSALLGTESLLPEYSSLNDIWQLATVHWLRANCYNNRADFRNAAAEYLLMRRYARQIRTPDLRAIATAGLIITYGNLEQIDEAQSAIEELNALARTGPIEQWMVYAMRGEGALHFRLGQFQESLEDYSADLAYAYRTNDQVEAADALQLLVMVMAKLGRRDDAVVLCTEGLERVDAWRKQAGGEMRSDVLAEMLNLIYKQGEMELESGRFGAAVALFRKGLSQPLGAMSEIECRLHLGLAAAYLRDRCCIDDALLQARRAIFLAAKGKYEGRLAQANMLLGEINKLKGRSDEALACFTNSIEILDRIRDRIQATETRQTFANGMYDPYKEIASLLVRKDIAAAAEFTGRVKSRSLEEWLHLSKAGDSAVIRDLRESRDPIVSYFFAADELIAFVSASGPTRAVRIPITEAEIGRKLANYLTAARNGDAATFDRLASELYRLLLDPILPPSIFAQIDHLIILPDGPLYQLPFAGLKDGGGRFLIEKVTLSYAPSQSVLQHCLEVGAGRSATGAANLVLIDGSSGLPAAQNELARLKSMYARKARFLDSGNLSAAQNLLPGADIVHFSGHAVLKLGKPALVLRSFPDEVLLDSDQIGAWQLKRSALVTLAGCETGIGPRSKGESPWGLIPAFLNAGAPALLVTLLPVDDEATLQFTTRFYELLSKGNIPKAEALQRAQLALLKDSDRKSLSWLPFALIGDPR